MYVTNIFSVTGFKYSSRHLFIDDLGAEVVHDACLVKIKTGIKYFTVSFVLSMSQ
jgi:hypothetical protein